jgi:Na+-transporting NADH:ubiquinone oxidoreductase subunit E
MNPFTAWFALFFAAVFTQNILLTNYLGMCPFLGASREIKTSFGLGAAVVFVMTFTTPLNWILNHRLLIPLGLEYLGLIVFICLIAAFTQLIELVIERVSDALYASLGIFLPLITVNCAILGASLFMVARSYTFLQTTAYGFGGGLGWMLAILAMAGIRQRIAKNRLPRGLEGAGIALIIAGLMAMAFTGFTGITAPS